MSHVNRRLPVIVQSHFRVPPMAAQSDTPPPLRTYEQETYIRNQKKMRENLKNMKSRVDNKRPKYYQGNNSPGKKGQLEEGKLLMCDFFRTLHCY